jgi:hypothetical protein
LVLAMPAGFVPARIPLEAEAAVVPFMPDVTLSRLTRRLHLSPRLSAYG